MQKCAEAVKQKLMDAGADKAEVYTTEAILLYMEKK